MCGITGLSNLQKIRHTTLSALSKEFLSCIFGGILEGYLSYVYLLPIGSPAKQAGCVRKVFMP